MKIHFVGIGGIGVSSLARFYLAKANQVSGSDLIGSEITESLEKDGVKIIIGSHRKENVSEDTELIIYSPAIEKNNPERNIAGVKTLSYPQALGELTKTHFTIAVCGTHGKSTTTSMLGLGLIRAGLDPTVIVGTKLKEFNNHNFRLGKSNYLIIEADEHMASFLNYSPTIIVLTRLEEDHLDYYKNYENIVKTFKKFILKLSSNGVLVFNNDDKNIRELIKDKDLKDIVKVKYTLKQNDSLRLRKILKVPGEHNVSNALAVLAVSRILKLKISSVFASLKDYHGAWRRFETFEKKGITLISDYGHHPTELAVTLKATREKYLKRRIICVFQPHQYQRTYYLFNQFVSAIAKAPVDIFILTDIYSVAGRETEAIKRKVSSKTLFQKIIEILPKSRKEMFVYIPTLEEAEEYLKKNVREKDVLVAMGAGNIYNLFLRLKE